MEVDKIGFFTKNKQKVREMNLLLIKDFYNESGSKLKYFGLPSEEMQDIYFWKDYLSSIGAVERGTRGQEFIKQHDLVLTSFLLGISDKLELYRGDMDDILIYGKDYFGNKIDYPYQLVNMDYTGGLFYKEDKDKSKRIDSIKSLLRNQAKFRQDFILLITCNFDNDFDAEYKNFIEKFILKSEDQKKESLSRLTIEILIKRLS
ncbi:hypothetical protein J4474_01855 [Candidatus Pacearchaeota archaeon]|nr:hypothetical protein [Candidatus Pacearchaeota archaeon]